jgi:probable phosphoglycerate mutase
VILLARHGETDDNVPPLRFQGQRDTPLNDVGRAQARELAERVAALDPPVASLWSSDLSRARETAEIVGARIGLEPRLDARLREGWRGEWEGFLFEQIEAADPERYAAWRAPREPDGFRFPGGESLAEQQARVLEALREIATAGDVSLVVCHGGSIRTMLCRREAQGLAAFHDFAVANVALVPVEASEL